MRVGVVTKVLRAAQGAHFHLAIHGNDLDLAAWSHDYRQEDNGARLGLTATDGTTREVAADHVIAGTGYRTDLTRLSFLSDSLLPALRTVPGTGSSVVDRNYQTSVPGLYVMGPAVAPTMGPVMRFVFGSEHAATTVARELTRGAVRRSQTAVAAGR